MSVYNHEVIAAYRDNNCTACFIMGRIDATHSIPTGSHANAIIESPGGEIEFVLTYVGREE